MMREKLMKKLQSKGKLDPLEQHAKMGVVKELSKQAGDMLGSQIHPLKKVTVAADSKEGLKAGLDKAAGLAEHMNEHETDPHKLLEQAEEETGHDLDHDNEEGESAAHKAKVLGHGMSHDASPAEGSPEEEAGESADEEMHEGTPDHEIDAKIAKLHALKAKKHGLR